MAGEIILQQMLTSELVNEFESCGFKLDIYIDCSHAANTKTVRSDWPNLPIISKPIEIDAAIKGINDKDRLGMAIGKLQSARNSSQLFRFYLELKTYINQIPRGLGWLASSDLKIEFPNFDSTIVNTQSPVISIKNAVEACNAANTAAFNLLSNDVRKSMGMYQRISVSQFSLQVGKRERFPRTAIVG